MALEQDGWNGMGETTAPSVAAEWTQRLCERERCRSEWEGNKACIISELYIVHAGNIVPVFQPHLIDGKQGVSGAALIALNAMFDGIRICIKCDDKHGDPVSAS